MKVSVRLSFTIISLALFFNVLAVTGVKAQIINEILKRMESHQKALSSLRAKVTMRKYNPQLNESDVSNGTAIYVRGYGKNLLTRIDWVKPTEETLSVVNNQYVFYRPRLKQAIVGKLNKAKENGNINNLFSFFNTPDSF